MIFHATFLLVENIKCDLHLTLNKNAFFKSTVLSSLLRCILVCWHKSVRNSFVGKRSCVGFCKKRSLLAFAKTQLTCFEEDGTFRSFRIANISQYFSKAKLKRVFLIEYENVKKIDISSNMCMPLFIGSDISHV